jgi:hypothetical protein
MSKESGRELYEQRVRKGVRPTSEAGGAPWLTGPHAEVARRVYHPAPHQPPNSRALDLPAL